MKNIVIIGPAYPLRGGLASFNERIAREFIAIGHKVTIYTFSLQYPNLLFPGKTQYATDPAPNDLDIHVKINSVNPFNWWKVGREIRNLRPDIVLCRFWIPFMGPCLGSILRIIKKNKHSEIIGLIDNIIPHEKRIGDKQLAQYFVNTVDRFVVMSRAVESELQRFIKKQITHYIPHPIYDNYGDAVTRAQAIQHLKLDIDTPYILFFGFIREYKGLDLLIKALNDDRIRALGIKLILAGEFYSNQADYEQLIKEQNVRNLIEFHTHYISNSDVRYYFCAADLVVQPYKTATQSGISQLAYHFCNPMLVTNVGGLPEIVKHGTAGYVVDVEVSAISDAIVDFYKNNKAAAFRAGVQEEKKRFSWRKMAEVIYKHD